ncbi:MAG: S1 RNA-binding domain-containing protein, partial [Clostridiales bacterium]|nr:S1 RNA-binding domain-containing protein [Clostridiales bacterium]
KAGVEESLVSYREGKKVKGKVISADDKGIRVSIGGKYDGIVYSNEVNIDETYDPANFTEGMEIEAIIIGKKDADTDCIPLSKRKVDLIKEGDKVVDSIRDGSVFEVIASSETKGGLLAKLGTYTVFVPASQVKEVGFPKDLKAYVKKRLRLTVLEIDDAKRKIIASQKKVLETERKEREEIFWANVVPNVVVSGTVKRITSFGAFVSVDGFDCLAHIVDLSWNHIKTVDEVLKIGETYDFLVLSVDREKGRVSLGYKQLQPHPFVVAMEKYPVGSVVSGKVVSIVPFGAFVQIEQGIEGLVHVSEASHSFIKNMNEIVKIGDTVDVKVLAIDEASRRITLSIKACLPEEPQPEPKKELTDEEREERNKKFANRPKKSERKPKEDDDSHKEWNEESSFNPFADLLKNLNIDENNN